MLNEDNNIPNDDDISHNISVNIPTELEDDPTTSFSQKTALSKIEKASSSTTRVKRHKNNDALFQVLNKRRMLLQEVSKTDEDDPIDVFFKCMALTVKKFSPELQIKAKMDVLKIVNELEFQNIRPVYQPGMR